MARPLSVVIDRHRIRENLRAIRATTRIDLIAVVKADAYGFGAGEIVEAVSDLVEGFYVFTLDEAIDAHIGERSGKPVLALAFDESIDAKVYLRHHVRPIVWNPRQAARLRDARPVLSVDTGMQRLACPARDIDAALRAGAIDEAFTHATRIDQVDRLIELVGRRGLKLHAAGTALLDDPRARLDAVRPGLAMYRGAARLATPLVETRAGIGPAGYTGFHADHHGIILAGYFNGLRPGPCRVNGRASRIIEVGMQSAFVELTPQDQPGDEVVLLDDTLTESEIAREWHCSPQEVLVHLVGSSNRLYSP